MRATVESMQQLATVDGQLCRVWEGVTEAGARLLLFVPFFCYSGRGNEDQAIAEAMLPGDRQHDVKILDALDA